ncbi:MAG: glutathione S-transferase family protein [Oscillatoriales cyanobacterium RM1_1_9]|nr:glutathione S-transferase family protein [Oscillatoriales cyanobacterium SM2_3_0]NJO47129.1 glutathione S-transferase family protein [Oscillatoriales cyanobacterium RM2_1_1]NJO71938.1 glutathione S-transferase family protein [Oscillatoriales cyanobacterium RM1_1_9]
MLKLYEMADSGNCYKIRLLLTQLQIPFERIPIDITQGQSRTVDFLAKNPNGRVPTVELESGEFLAESNAILYYFSQGTRLFPRDPWEQAQIMQWMFFEQYSHEPFIATSRYWISILGKAEEYREQLEHKQEPGYAALKVMEHHLNSSLNNQFFVGNCYSIADICLFAYTHVAHEGGFELRGFPAIQAWIQRINAQPGYISMAQKDS